MSVRVSSGNYLSRSGGIPASHQAFSACVWFKRKVDTGIGEFILHFGTGTNPIQVRIGDDDTLRLNLQYSGSRLVNAGTVAVDEWVFVGVACSGTTATLYWRREDESGLSSGTASNTGSDWTTDNLYVGRDAGTTPFNPFDGLVANLRVWDVALSGSEMLAEAAASAAVRTSDLLSDHAMTGANIAAAVVDDSGEGNDFTATGSPTVDADMPTTTAGSDIGRPDSDVSAGTWTPSTGSDLYAMIDEETPSDADYITASSSGTCEVMISTMNAPTGGWETTVRYRVEGDITVSLREGASTEIATWTHSAGSPTTYTQTLSSGEQSSITDWTDLRLRFVK
jgi:hypothetical protein